MSPFFCYIGPQLVIAALTGSSVYRYAERFRVTGNVRLSAKKNGPAQLLYEFEELPIQAHLPLRVAVHTNLQNSASVRNNTAAHKAAEFWNHPWLMRSKKNALRKYGYAIRGQPPLERVLLIWTGLDWKKRQK